MDKKKVRKSLFIGYGGLAVVLFLVFGVIALVCGKEELIRGLQRNPMAVVDVFILSAIVGGYLVHICLADEYRIASVFRVERQKFYKERSLVLELCGFCSAGIAILFKVFYEVGMGAMENKSMGEMVAYWCIIGILYAAGMTLVLTFIDTIPVEIMLLTYINIEGLMVFLTLLRVKVPLVTPSYRAVAVILAVICFVLIIPLKKYHEAYYKRLDC